MLLGQLKPPVLRDGGVFPGTAALPNLRQPERLNGPLFGGGPQVSGNQESRCHGRAADKAGQKQRPFPPPAVPRGRPEDSGARAAARRRGRGGARAPRPRHVTGPSWRRPEAYPAPGSRLRGAGALLEPEPEPEPEGERAGRPGGLEPDVSGASPQTGAAGETVSRRRERVWRRRGSGQGPGGARGCP